MDKTTEQKLLKIVKDGYEQIADDFAITRDKRLWPEILKLAEMVKDGDSVLDVGCGNGRLAGAFEGRQIVYVGVDESGKLIEIARNNFQFPISNFQTISNFQFSNGSILNLGDIIKEKFSYIFCIAVLHHLPGEDLRVEALRQMKNKLAENGKVVISVWNLWTRWKYLKLILKFAWRKIIGQNKTDFGDIIFDWKNSKGEILGQRYYHAFTKRELAIIVRQAGLKIEKLYKDKYNYYLVLKSTL